MPRLLTGGYINWKNNKKNNDKKTTS